MNSIKNLFDRRSVRTHRDRSAIKFCDHNYLFHEIAGRLCEKLDDINRKFEFGLDLGCHSGETSKLLSVKHQATNWVRTDMSFQLSKIASKKTGAPVLVMDEEFIAFKKHSFDIVISNLSLHWANDLPGTLAQISKVLKPDGVILISLFGEQTLHELKMCLSRAEIEEENGLSPRVSAFSTIQDLGNLLIRAGFALPVADVEKITVYYPHAMKLMRDLRAMGESNSANLRRKSFSRKTTMMRTSQLYQEKFENEANQVPATFDVITLTGWSPDISQPKPLKPGSGQVNLNNFLNAKK